MNQLLDGVLERINRRPRSKQEPVVVEPANVSRVAPQGPPEVTLLIVEDSPDDLELILRELRRGGLAFVWRWVDTEAHYVSELQRTDLAQVILADYSLPQFNALRALELLRERQLDIPFIVVTGTIREEDAVSCMKQGADDYLIKDRYARLVPAIYNALEEKRLRDEKHAVEEAVRQSEQRYRSLVEHSPDAILVTHEGSISYVNDAGVRLFGAADRQELVGKSYVDFVHPSFLARVHRRARQMQEGEPDPGDGATTAAIGRLADRRRGGRHRLHLRRQSGDPADRSRRERTPPRTGSGPAAIGRIDPRHPANDNGRNRLRTGPRDQSAAVRSGEFRRSVQQSAAPRMPRIAKNCCNGRSRSRPKPIGPARSFATSAASFASRLPSKSRPI